MGDHGHRIAWFPIAASRLRGEAADDCRYCTDVLNCITGVTLVKFETSADNVLAASEATASRAPCSVAKLRMIVAI